MTNLIKMTLPGLLISYLLFDYLYRKWGISAKIGKKASRRLIAFLMVFSLYVIGVMIIDSISITKGYHDFFIGLFFGPVASFMPFIIPKGRDKTKTKSKLKTNPQPRPKVKVKRK